MKSRLLSTIATDLQEGDYLTNELLVICGPLLPTMKVAAPLENGPLIAGPSLDRGPPCHSDSVLGKRDGNLRMS